MRGNATRPDKYIVVPAANAAELVQIVNAYAGERAIFIRGNYQVEAALSIPANTHIEGDGRETTSIQQLTNNTNVIEAADTPSSDCILRDFEIIGRKAGRETVETGIGIYGCFYRSVFENLRVNFCGRNIYLMHATEWCWENMIIRCDLSNSVNNNVEFGSKSSDNLILGGNIRFAGYHASNPWQSSVGLKCNTVSNHKIIGCTIEDNWRNVEMLDGAMLLQGCSLDDAQRENILVKATTAHVTYPQIIACKIKDADEEGVNANHITLQGDGSSNYVRNGIIALNTFDGTGAPYCVYFADAFVGNITILGNDTRWGYGTAPVGGVALPTGFCRGHDTPGTGSDEHSIEYQTQTGAWANPTGLTWNGRNVLVYNSTATQYRLYAYLNAGWRYAVLT